jgi:hypothetical protein
VFFKIDESVVHWRRDMNRVVAMFILASMFMGVGARAQQVNTSTERPIKTTYVRLANNANAIIVEPVTPDPQRSRFAILIAHPEHNNNFNYFIAPQLSRRGYRVMMMNYYGPEQVYEEFLAPLSAAVKYLRSIPGVQEVVLAGHSTGGPELAFYQEVAENGAKACRGAERVYPCRGDNLDKLPRADGLLIIDSNAGAIERLIALDPSLDSSRPRDHSPELDMFNARNGYNPQARSGTYSAEFERKYLQAQGTRQTRLIESASARLAMIEKGEGDYKDDEPFVIPGSSQHTNDGARLDIADLRLLSKTHAAHRLLKADGTTSMQIVPSTRAPLAEADDMDRMNPTTQNVTVRYFLSFLAMRPKADYGLKTDRVTGVEWRSVANSLPGNVQGITVPSLFVAATCAPHLVFLETAYDLSAAKDKEFIGVEGADHSFRPCKPEYGDPAKRAFDYVDGWLMKAGRF